MDALSTAEIAARFAAFTLTVVPLAVIVIGSLWFFKRHIDKGSADRNPHTHLSRFD